MKKIIITVGPSFFKQNVFNSLNNLDYILRINGAHGNIDEIRNTILQIRKIENNSKILIDLPGNKIRTSSNFETIKVAIGKSFELKNDKVNYNDFIKYVNTGDIILANDSTLKFEVSEKRDNGVILKSHSNGKLEKNKGLHVKGLTNKLPFLFQKDLDLIKLAKKEKISHIGLSFVRDENDIKQAKKLIGNKIEIIAKIETKKAVENLIKIFNLVEYILIDRGDLSAELDGIEQLPFYQMKILEKALVYQKKALLATQFLSSMMDKPIPTIAEVIDLYNTFKKGVYGIQLSEETAVGNFPNECILIVKKIVEQLGNEEIIPASQFLSKDETYELSKQ